MVLLLIPAALLACPPAAPGADTGPFGYVSPGPGARLVNKGTTIVLRAAETGGTRAPEMVTSLVAHGSRSGLHVGRTVIATDRETFVFRPDEPFEAGETVTVSVGLRGRPVDYPFRFYVSPKTREPEWRSTESPEDGWSAVPERRGAEDQPPRSRRGNGFTLPQDFPPVDVLVSDNPDDGFLFLANRPGPASPNGHYIMALDNTGWPVFFREMPGEPWDFKRQPATGLLTYFLRVPAPDRRNFAIDSTYTFVDSWVPGNGYDIGSNNGHDFQMLANGHVLLMIYDHQVIDMSQIVPGGCPSAIVRGVVLQELDPQHNVVFQWRSWDHLQIADAVHEDLTACFIDYVHTNSMEYDTDGNIFISNRSIEEVLKLDRQTGDVIWRMGGSQNEFTLVGDTQWYTAQHSARRTAAGTIIVFDNANYSTPFESRAVEYVVDEVNKIATLVWEFRHDPPIAAGSTGNVQRLPNGNTLISWGPTGVVTEVRPNGTTAFELEFTGVADRTYVAYRFPGTGVAAAPTLWADEPDSAVTLHFTKFGDPDVAQFHVYRGDSPEPMTVVGSTTESSYTLTDVAPGETLYVRVTAEDAAMIESPFSNELEIMIPHVPTAAREINTVGVGPDFALRQSRPNPFGRATTIPFVLPERGLVSLSVYDVRGRLVRTVRRDMHGPGLVEVVWDGNNDQGRPASSGVYFYRLDAGGRSLSRVMTLRR